MPATEPENPKLSNVEWPTIIPYCVNSTQIKIARFKKRVVKKKQRDSVRNAEWSLENCENGL